MKFSTLFFAFVFLSVSVCSHGQAYVPFDSLSNVDIEPSTKQPLPNKYTLLTLPDGEALVSLLKRAPTRDDVKESDERRPTLTLPLPDGRSITFSWLSTPTFSPGLALKYPDILAFTGVAVHDRGVSAKLDIGVHGVNVMIRVPDEGMYFIAPYRHEDDIYMCYAKEDLGRQPFQCLLADDHDHDHDHHHHAHSNISTRAGDCQLRQYRLAVGCTGEYTAFHGGTVAGALSAVNTSINVINGVYEAEMGITMQLVTNNDAIIYTDATTDPYTNSSASTMLNENQVTCDAIIGDANYDIGHVFARTGGGIAQLRSPCSSGAKARGVSGTNDPIGPVFNIDLAAHEFGHQYGANHTQNNACNRNFSTAFEPGSASTIMGYAGICSPNVQLNSDPYFHGVSLDEMGAFVTNAFTGGSCPTVLSSAGDAPVVQTPADRTLPVSTPFVLAASSTDPGGDPLTYSWEHWDNGIAPMPPQSTSTTGPSFRSLLPTTSPARVFPDPAPSTWEVLPSVSRTTSFRVSVRDFDSTLGYGCSDEAFMTATFDASAGPFLVSYPNGGEILLKDSSYTVTWDVAGTNNPPVSNSHVDILLSIDGGATYPYLLADSTDNDGLESVQLPMGITTSEARIRLDAANNVFFDISDGDFAISDVTLIPDTTCRTIRVVVGDTIFNGQTTVGTASYIDSGSIYSVVVDAITGTHSWVQDLTMTLVAPTGDRITLISGQCGSSDDFDLGFDDRSTQALQCPLSQGQVLPPEGSLGSLMNKEVIGTWRIEIEDTFPDDGGIFESFAITICADWSDCDPELIFDDGVVPTGMSAAGQRIEVQVPFAPGATTLTAPEIDLLPGADVPLNAEVMLMPGGCN